MARFVTVLITGASSGIGRALAEACAGPDVTLHLSGRDEMRLEGVATACGARGAAVHPEITAARATVESESTSLFIEVPPMGGGVSVTQH